MTWTSYESIGNGHWEYLEKKAYEIPLTETTSERVKSTDEARRAMADSFV